MSNTPRDLTRNQLAEFLPNLRAVRAFEQLLKQVNDLIPSEIATITRLVQEASLEASSGVSKSQAALDLLAAIDQDSKTGAWVNTGIKNNSISTDYIDFNNNPRLSRMPGRVHWGATGTLEVEMGGGNITQQVGEEFFIYGKASSAISDGKLVMVTGTVGASGVITFANSSTNLLDPNSIVGIATENIAINDFGRVTVAGVVRGIDTTGSSVGETWADGDVLWYNKNVVGGMTKVKPIAPNMKTQVAIIISAGPAGSGSLQVGIVGGSSLGGTDSDVQLGALADKQVLQYDGAIGYWKNVALDTIGSTAAETHAAASKTTPVDADELPLADSASFFSLKKLTWSNIKATLLTWLQGTVFPSPGAIGATTPSTGKFTTITVSGGAQFVTTSSDLTNGAGAAAGTLTNAPVSGNPTKWIGINDNGTIRYIPTW